LIILTVLLLLLSGLYLGFKSPGVQSFVVNRITAKLSKSSNIRLHIGKVRFSPFNKIELGNVWIEDEHTDTLIHINLISASLCGVSLKEKSLLFGVITLKDPRIKIQKSEAGIYNFRELLQSFAADTTSGGGWSYHCNRFRIRNARFEYVDMAQKPGIYLVRELHIGIDHFRATPDSLQFRIGYLRLTDSNGFTVKHLTADLKSLGNVISIQNLFLKTENSQIDSSAIQIRQDTLPDTRETMLVAEVDLRRSQLGFADLAMFIPSLKGMDQKVEISGSLSGTPGNVKAKNIRVKTGNYTNIHCDLSVNFFDDMTEPFLFLDMKLSQTDFRDLSAIRLPDQSATKYLKFPNLLTKAGIITYQGNFTGFLSDFVAYGTISSRMGRIKTDLSFVPVSGNVIRYKGQLGTADFDLGALLKNDILGKLSLNSVVDGIYTKSSQKIEGEISGTISEIAFNNYKYRNVELDGKINNRKFDGKVRLDDQNLKLDFSGELDMNEKMPIFDFVMNLKRGDLVALHFDTLNTHSEIAFEMAANFSGNSIDNLDGLIQVFNGTYFNQNDSLHFDNLTVNTHLGEKLSRISILSDYINGNITGTYHFGSLYDSFRNVLARYLPSLGTGNPAKMNTNQFRYEFEVHNLDEIASVFLPGLQAPGSIRLNGLIDSSTSGFEMVGIVPAVKYGELSLHDIDIHVNPENERLSSVIRVKQLSPAKGIHFDNLELSMDAANNRINNHLEWKNQSGSRYSASIGSEITFLDRPPGKNPAVRISIRPSDVIIHDSVWHLAPAVITLDSSVVDVSGFGFSFNQQNIGIEGRISRNENDIILLSFSNLNLDQLNNYIKDDEGIRGVLNGSVGISDFYRNRIFFSDLLLTGFEFREQPLGDISLITKWDRETRRIGSELKVEYNKRNHLVGRGFFSPEEQELDYTLDFDNQSLVILGSIIGDDLTNFHGDASGRVRVHGKPEKILHDGALYCKNAGLTVDYTQVSYNLSDSVRFRDDKIIFKNIQITDITGNRGIFNGFIRHESFGNLEYDLKIYSDKILAINNKALQSPQFYGKGVMRGNIAIKGDDHGIKLSGEATSLPETMFNIVLSDETEVTKYDFVRFVSKTKEPEVVPVKIRPDEDGGLEIDLLVHATPDAKVQMLFSTLISDEIRAQGEGTLRFGMDKKGNISLSGNYTVEQGEYLFTLQGVINKRFTIDPGGSLTWSGDPYNAVIDLNAVYKLKASLYELKSVSPGNQGSSQRIPVECRIALTGDLMRPDIGLSIDFPALEERLKDELQQYFSTPEDMNRQMLSLLVLGKFYTPEFMRGTYEATTTGLIGNTASDLFSKQLSNWLSQINKDVDIGFNYRPGNQITNDEIELALSTQIFNDRVTINGNIGNNANPNSINNSELVGDFDINVKLTRNGKLQLKAYSRANNNLIYETAPYTQGIGISYKENYNSFGELLKSFYSLFRKETTRKQVVPNRAEPNGDEL